MKLELIEALGRAVDAWEAQVREAETDGAFRHIDPTPDNLLRALRSATKCLSTKQSIIDAGLALATGLLSIMADVMALPPVLATIRVLPVIPF